MLFDVLLLLIVVWVGFRLFSALGQNPLSVQGEVGLKEPKKAPILTMENEIKSLLPSYSENSFKQGATQAFEYIIQSFTSGETKNLEPLLEKEMFETYQLTIQKRLEKKISCKLLFFRHISTQPISFSHKGNKIFIKVRFRSEQTLALYDRDDQLIQGNPDQSEILEDVWTFACTLPTKKEAWLLSAIS